MRIGADRRGREMTKVINWNMLDREGYLYVNYAYTEHDGCFNLSDV